MKSLHKNQKKCKKISYQAGSCKKISFQAGSCKKSKFNCLYKAYKKIAFINHRKKTPPINHSSYSLYQQTGATCSIHCRIFPSQGTTFAQSFLCFFNPSSSGSSPVFLWRWSFLYSLCCSGVLLFFGRMEFIGRGLNKCKRFGDFMQMFFRGDHTVQENYFYKVII